MENCAQLPVGSLAVYHQAWGPNSKDYWGLSHLNARLLRAAMRTKSLFHFFLLNFNLSKSGGKKKEPPMWQLWRPEGQRGEACRLTPGVRPEECSEVSLGNKGSCSGRPYTAGAQSVGALCKHSRESWRDQNTQKGGISNHTFSHYSLPNQAGEQWGSGGYTVSFYASTKPSLQLPLQEP